MRVFRSVAATALGALVLTVGLASAQVPATIADFGAPVYPAFEGWYLNGDGTATILIGYFNPNRAETFDVPIGELNYFTPGPQDRGQPTHFELDRGWGVFSIKVPDDFEGDLAWTLVINDQPVTIPFHLDAPYFVEPLKDPANNNEPPTIRFTETGDGVTGPPIGIAYTMTARVDTPVELSVWLSDVMPNVNVRDNPRRRRPPMALNWHLSRGPGYVVFEESGHELESADPQQVTTTATFDTAGTYVLRAEALDSTGEGGSGFQCCWTSALIEVTVQ
jgi:hypothetical protein